MSVHAIGSFRIGYRTAQQPTIRNVAAPDAHTRCGSFPVAVSTSFQLDLEQATMENLDFVPSGPVDDGNMLPCNAAIV